MQTFEEGEKEPPFHCGCTTPFKAHTYEASVYVHISVCLRLLLRYTLLDGSSSSTTFDLLPGHRGASGGLLKGRWLIV